jgi:hypothetical protein
MSMFYKLASAVLARTTVRAVVAMRFRRKIQCAFGARRFVAEDWGQWSARSARRSSR